MEGSSGSKGLKMDTDGKVTFTEDATFAGDVQIDGGDMTIVKQNGFAILTTLALVLYCII